MSLKRFIIFTIALLAFSIIIDFNAFEPDPNLGPSIMEQCVQWVESFGAPGQLFR